MIKVKTRLIRVHISLKTKYTTDTNCIRRTRNRTMKKKLFSESLINVKMFESFKWRSYIVKYLFVSYVNINFSFKKLFHLCKNKKKDCSRNKLYFNDLFDVRPLAITLDSKKLQQKKQIFYQQLKFSITLYIPRNSLRVRPRNVRIPSEFVYNNNGL